MILPPNVNGPYSQQPFGFPGQQPPVYGLRPGAPMGPGGFPLAQPFPQAPAFSSPPLAAGGLYQLPHGPVIASNQKIAGNGSFWLSWKGLASVTGALAGTLYMVAGLKGHGWVPLQNFYNAIRGILVNGSEKAVASAETAVHQLKHFREEVTTGLKSGSEQKEGLDPAVKTLDGLIGDVKQLVPDNTEHHALLDTLKTKLGEAQSALKGDGLTTAHQKAVQDAHAEVNTQVFKNAELFKPALKKQVDSAHDALAANAQSLLGKLEGETPLQGNELKDALDELKKALTAHQAEAEEMLVDASGLKALKAPEGATAAEAKAALQTFKAHLEQLKANGYKSATSKTPAPPVASDGGKHSADVPAPVTGSGSEPNLGVNKPANHSERNTVTENAQTEKGKPLPEGGENGGPDPNSGSPPASNTEQADMKASSEPEIDSNKNQPWTDALPDWMIYYADGARARFTNVKNYFQEMRNPSASKSFLKKAEPVPKQPGLQPDPNAPVAGSSASKSFLEKAEPVPKQPGLQPDPNAPVAGSSASKPTVTQLEKAATQSKPVLAPPATTAVKATAPPDDLLAVM